MPTTLSRSPTHPWPKVLKLRLSPKGARFRVGERVKGQLKLTSYGYATGYEFHLTYYRSIETDSLTRRMALGHLVMTSEHFKVDGVGVFGFPQRVDALPFQSGHFTLSDYVELTVHRTGSQDIVYRQSKPLIVRNSGVTYRPRSARLHLTGQRIDEGALPLLSMVDGVLALFRSQRREPAGSRTHHLCPPAYLFLSPLATVTAASPGPASILEIRPPITGSSSSRRPTSFRWSTLTLRSGSVKCTGK